VAVMVGTPRSAQGVCSVVFFPLLFLSGVVFPIDVFPAPLQALACWLPGYRVSELLASAWVEGQVFDWWSLAYVIVVLIIAMFTAKWLLARREDV
ncbi:ABC transporter permease, partial [Canibacter sp. lx-45]